MKVPPKAPHRIHPGDRTTAVEEKLKRRKDVSFK